MINRLVLIYINIFLSMCIDGYLQIMHLYKNQFDLFICRQKNYIP
jgi:hypothetical protein